MDLVMGSCGLEPRQNSSKQNDTSTEPSTGVCVLDVCKIPDAKYQVVVNETCAHFFFHRLPKQPIFLACHPKWNQVFTAFANLKLESFSRSLYYL